MENQIIYTTISPEYLPEWGIQEALRELLQEGFDVREIYNCDSRFQYDETRNVFEIIDDGPGLKLSDLALGTSRGKRDNNSTIGQFGEGLKMACLVLRRMERYMEIETVGFTLKPTIINNDQIQCKTLAFLIHRNNKNRGTRVAIETTKEEVQEACSLFLELNKNIYRKVNDRHLGKDDDIFLPGGQIFICGVKVQEYKDNRWLFSYNINNKQLVNRDRWAIGVEECYREIGKLWTYTKDEDAVRKLIKEVVGYGLHERSSREDNFGELHLTFDPSASSIDIWKKVVTEEIINKSIILNDHISSAGNRRLEEMGYGLLDVPWNAYSLLKTLGVPTASQVNEQLGTYRIVKSSHLDAHQKLILREIKRLAKKHFSKYFHDQEIPKIKVARFLTSDTIGGCYLKESHDIIISEDKLHDLKEAVRITVHEMAHAVSKGEDYSDRLIGQLEYFITDLILSSKRTKEKI